MNSTVLRFDHRQQPTLSPRLQHAVRLLQLSSIDFAQEVRNALGRNPFLEAEENDSADGIEPPLADTPMVDDGFGAPLGADGEEARSALDAMGGEYDGERDSWQRDGSAASRRLNEDGDLSSMDTMAVEVSLHDHLHSQLNVMPLPMRDLLLAKAVVESLDDDGYLRFDLTELIEIAQLDPPASPDELSIALTRVQALEPAGVGARNVAECLRLQLNSIENEEQRRLARRIVDERMDQLAARDISGLAKALELSPIAVEAVCDRIRRLDPRPGWRYGGSGAQYLTPDVIVRKVRGEWTVSLNPVIAPRVRLNKVYAEMFQRHRSAHAAEGPNTEMSAHLQEARWTLRNIEQRFATILGVAQEIVRRQKHFFEFGPMAMKPLGLRDVADEVGIHESTVSRVTNNKYMATPAGVFELKYFFSRAMPTQSGASCSGTAIRGLIRDMIEAEKPDHPLSDAEIARQLARQGLVVARRTVTKYRQLLKIEAVERRRRHGAVAA
ncbi:MAG TPA: RNA polymerase factor sigma-54 [Methylibium sp.]|uniref:RNA polymerase factor sigma-54 n=1 Tax=Methylibium sp. TaxID=2067992 RepID=UPI002DB6551E|nr:RNA polymerase factor sigma-54 [Methylibium sp.]HEU4459097.1 RNA polymerase factor sigma-54 [Methylibium sp.]